MKRISLIILIVLSSIQFCFADRLSSAIFNGDLEKVKSCIEEQGIDVNRLDDNYFQISTVPLWESVYYMSSKQGSPEGMEIVKYLISKGADINWCYTNYFKGNIDSSCLDYVIYQSQTNSWKKYYTELFDILYAKGAKISDYSLRWAVEAGNGEIIETLAKSGKFNQVAYTDALYRTVNNVYVEGRFSGNIKPDDAIKYIELFLKNGADINYKSSSGLSPLMMSATMFAGEVDTRIMKCLIDNGADINSTDKNGNSIFMNLSPSYWKWYGDKIELYLDSQPNINLKNKNKQTAIARFIKADLQEKENYNEKQREQLFEKLIDLNADFLDKDVEIPYIILATQYHRNDIVKYLIGLGADITVKDNNGKDALYYSYNTEDQDLINILKNPEPTRQEMLVQINAKNKKREEINKLSDAIKIKDFDYVKSTMEKYALIPESKLSNGKSIYESVFECFLKDEDSQYLDFLTDTKNYANIQIDFNADEQLWYYSLDSYYKRVDDFDNIPSEKLAEYLKKQIDAKFSENFKRIKTKKNKEPIIYSYIDSNFDSILIYAIKNNDQKTANMLIKQQVVDLSYTNKAGKTALDYAKEQGLKSIIKAIEGK